MARTICYTGVAGSGLALTASRLIKERGGQALILTSSANQAERLAQDLSFFTDTKVLVLPDLERAVLRYEARSPEDLAARLKVLTNLALGRDCVVVAPVMGALRKLPPREVFLRDLLEVKVGEELDRDELSERLVKLGYERTSLVEAAGQFAVRGDIVDIFSPASDVPVRLEFFDTEVDSIRVFDPATQRSEKNISAFTLYPAAVVLRDEAAFERARKKIARYHQDETGEYLLHCMDDIKNYQPLENYISYFYPETELIWDYLKKPAFVMAEDPSRLSEVIEFNESEETEDRKAALENGRAVPEDFKSFPDPEDYYALSGRARDFDLIYASAFAQQIKGVERLDTLTDLELRQAPVFAGRMDVFETDLKRFLKQGYKISIACSNGDRFVNLRDFLGRAGLAEKVSLLSGKLSQGTDDPVKKELWLSESDIFPGAPRGRSRAAKKRGAIKAFSDIKKGDYVVHETHGVGRFVGVEKLEIQGAVSDYLKIQYAGADVLYVPVEQMDLIQKYMGGDGVTPKINGLSSGEWQKTKSRAKAAIRDMTEDFLKLAAQRESAKGYQFGPDTVWQKEFEDSFPYEETADQLRSTAEIKKDMMSGKAMDRLLCGDVGYGKTEVAARAIFKCLEEGKQAAVLVPTTVLCSQHYRTFTERFAGYPFAMDMLCRFRTDKQQEEIVEKINSGELDLVVGTHRLLSEDVKFKDLGLLVVDEEQRFGVEHKDAIKKLKANTDVLTLSATPIPRTLHMSLIGIRDMSMLEEPPADRYPVQTYVMQEDERVIADCIRRELGRNGQVYVVYNKVAGIQSVASRIRDLVPEARVITGHGQMGERQLENVMVDFVEGRADVLVATTIIESGLDIPNVNTMIVLNADFFGLSQLYQLRGRIGRSNRMAYAYLMYKRDKVLSEIAEKRLKAIREFTEFGSGFRLAMRDLELRGAGNILGVEQSGHMLSIGYELYCKLVEEAVRELKGGPVKDPFEEREASIELAIPAYLPEYYVADELTRLSEYKRIAAISDEEERDDVFDELLDRFGEPPKEAVNLLDIALLRHMASALGVEKLVRQQNRLVLVFYEDNRLKPEAMASLMDAMGARLTIYGGVKPRLAVVMKGSSPQTEAKAVLKALTIK